MVDPACELTIAFAVALSLLACRQERVSPASAGVAAAGRAAVALDAGPPPHAARVSLIDHAQWLPLGPEEDPFADRPQDDACPAQAAAPELLSDELAYGVDTGSCRYVTARQRTREPVVAGESLHVRLWHFQLDAPEPGEAHAVIELDGLRVLEARVPIPAPGGLLHVELPSPRAIAAGAPVYFHLHNHGANSWALVEISTGP